MNSSSYVVAVRSLVEFTAKQGDLDFRFTPSPSGLEGIEGHQQVAARRKPNYQREIRLEGRYEELVIKGRADGFDPDRVQLEEIKTYRGDFHAIPENHHQLHWAQAKIYGYLLCQQHALPELSLALIYYDIDRLTEIPLTETFDIATLAHFFEQTCRRFLAWARHESTHRRQRDQALRVMPFPHPSFRAGQRELAEAMFKASNRACCLLAQAPTGIGKTIASLFPMLKAIAEHQLDKLFFLTAKTSGRKVALNAIATMQEKLPPSSLRALELVAKANACEFPENACHGEACPLAKRFYDRLPEARAAAAGIAILDQAQLREVALSHQICPYYLSIEMAKWSDIVVGDYNYYFDLNAMLYGLALNNNWKISVLIDEAHNMVARAREMYTIELHSARFKEMQRQAPPELKKACDKVRRQWRMLEKSDLIQSKGIDSYQVHAQLPDKLTKTLISLCAEIGSYFVDHPSANNSGLQEFYFNALIFIRLSECFGEHSIFDVSMKQNGSILCIRNIVPAPFLQARFKASHTSALFSATLTPWNYYSDLLGMPEKTAWVDVESPFDPEQLAVHVVETVSTRYADRHQSLTPITDLMANQFDQTPGAYLAFFSSFEYMDQVASLFTQRFPHISTWVQTRKMDEASKNRFIANFTEDSQGVGFAVLGGAFGEGIDLPGTRLIGAFIATLGLPQINPINEQIKQRMYQLFGFGYDYTYLYPGLQKVVQAAGRVIRTNTDRGVIYLIDDRFQQDQIQALLPRWWKR
ncbi:ATP-dependent DNA helicase [Undibacterium fentianense]|uniref:ATP-dependent DNA helicase n=1 Tax=Undibacterium fentianense TaxID=2828728 RepID=UPI002E369D35|nr:ATP-dependent DNA helicase [Undibacterium fentianense]